MNKDILGKRELDSIKLNWNFAKPGLMTTRCCGTGTCDNHPDPNSLISSSLQVICFSFDLNSLQDITKRYGYLRS